MKVLKTEFAGLFILEPEIYEDSRGYFTESYNQERLRKAGIEFEFVQDNESYSRRGVLRGLHFQASPYAQTKLVRVISGNILDVVVDMRPSQATFGRHFSVELSEDNRRQLLVPKGFAHGFVVWSSSARVLYKCDEFYRPEAEGGIRFDDPTLQIDWGIAYDDLLISAKDLKLPFMQTSDMADGVFS